MLRWSRSSRYEPEGTDAGATRPTSAARDRPLGCRTEPASRRALRVAIESVRRALSSPDRNLRQCEDVPWLEADVRRSTHDANQSERGSHLCITTHTGPMTAISPPPTDTGRLRLHITPFNASLYDRLIPASIQPLAQDVSYHTVQTFPERGFGYVELPAMEAEKLKKKLNGSIFKGSKVRIEEARPEKGLNKKRDAEGDDDEDERRAKKRARRERKEKRNTDGKVLSGHELEEGRHVKRGWTDADGAKKSRGKSTKSEEKAMRAKHTTDGKKMRFKTSVPPNAVPLDAKVKPKAKDKKLKGSKLKKTTIVQEFSRSRNPSQGVAPSVSDSKPVVAYEDGRGWVDEDGNVVEAERPSKRKKRPQVESEQDGGAETNHRKRELDDQVLRVKLSATDEMDLDSPLDDHATAPENESAKDLQLAEAQENDDASDTSDLDSNKSTTSIDEQDSQDDEPESSAKAVHPLEALYKRSAPDAASAGKHRLAPIDTSFSFFGSEPNDAAAADAAEEGDNPAAHPPQTPHTREDIEWRAQRSAAPTPDTAAIGKRFSFVFGPDEDEDGDGDGDDGDEGDAGHEARSRWLEERGGSGKGSEVAKAGAQEESAFRKLFYEKRGESDRAWKRRRREMKKQQRQRENRRLSRRVV